MIHLNDNYALELPADLESGRAGVCGVLAWLRFRGHQPETLQRWRLPVTEAVNNAIIHGCHGRSPARVIVSARLHGTGTEVRVSDPGHYEPPPGSGEFNPDLLGEHGRGAFLIAQYTDRIEHRNGPDGHTVVLGWSTLPVVSKFPLTCPGADDALDQMAQQLGGAYETLTAYAEFAGLLATTTDFPELLAQVQQRLALSVPHKHFLLRFASGDSLVLYSPSAPFPVAIAHTPPGLEAGVAAKRNCVALASPAEIPLSDPLGLAEGPLVIVAVGSGEKNCGTLTVVRAADAPAFTAGEIVFTQAVANFLSSAHRLAEHWAQRSEQAKLEQEFQIAGQIQGRLLPQAAPTIAGWNVTGGCRPSRAVGGDYYDWIVRPNGSCLIVVADVMGKGMPAAMVATMLRSTWRTLAAQIDGPGRLLTELNTQLGPDLAALNVFITAVLIQLAPHGSRVAYANAGHCALLQRPARENVLRYHDTGGIPLGIDATAVYSETSFPSERGDSLFAFTDGCYEIDRQIGVSAGLAALTAELHDAADKFPDSVVPRILNRLQEKAGGSLPDDCTLVALHHHS